MAAAAEATQWSCIRSAEPSAATRHRRHLAEDAAAEADTGRTPTSGPPGSRPWRRYRPASPRCSAWAYPFDLDRLFEFGLQRLLDGLTPLVERGETVAR